MLPVMCGAIVRMSHSLPDKQRTANPIRQTVPLSGLAEPDRPLALTTSRNRPALGASSNEGDRDSGAQSNRAGWLGKVWKRRSALPCRCAPHRRGWPSAGGNPQEDRTQISEPQVKNLHKCALRATRIWTNRYNEIDSKGAICKGSKSGLLFFSNELTHRA